MADFTNTNEVMRLLEQESFKSTILDKTEIINKIKKKIIGHTLEIETIVEQIRNRIATNPQKREGPIGVFMLLGPPGTGKTTLAKEIASAVYGEDRGFFVVDMNSCSNTHSAWTYFGSAQGYAGGPGSLTLAILANKEKGLLILLDEFEKADSDVHRMFLNAWATGFITDNRTGAISTKNTIWVLTSNAATESISDVKKGNTDRDDFNEQCVQILSTTGGKEGGFAPEVLNRINEFFYLEIPKDEQQVNIIISMFANLAELYDMKLADPQNSSHPIQSELVVAAVKKLKSLNKGGIRAIQRWIAREASSQIVDAKSTGATQIAFSLEADKIKVTHFP